MSSVYKYYDVWENDKMREISLKVLKKFILGTH